MNTKILELLRKERATALEEVAKLNDAIRFLGGNGVIDGARKTTIRPAQGPPVKGWDKPWRRSPEKMGVKRQRAWGVRSKNSKLVVHAIWHAQGRITERQVCAEVMAKGFNPGVRTVKQSVRQVVRELEAAKIVKILPISGQIRFTNKGKKAYKEWVAREAVNGASS